MQDWINEYVAMITGLWEFAQTSPVFFGVTMTFGLGIIWLKWWVIGKSQKKARAGLTAGWSRNAQKRAVVHETGIGTQQVLVMKPANKPLRTGLLCTVFFGAFTYVGFIQIQHADATLKVWIVFGIMFCFTLMGLFVMCMAFTRIVVKEDSLEHKRLFRRSAVYSLPSITKIEPMAGSLVRGVKLTFRDGRRLRVGAVMSGYGAFLARLAKKDRKIGLLLQLIERSNARTARG